MGDQFEDREHKLFGQNGFNSFVDKVAGLERQIGMYELDVFTPA